MLFSGFELWSDCSAGGNLLARDLTGFRTGAPSATGSLKGRIANQYMGRSYAFRYNSLLITTNDPIPQSKRSTHYLSLAAAKNGGAKGDGFLELGPKRHTANLQLTGERHMSQRWRWF
jgi:hypothetical protein